MKKFALLLTVIFIFNLQADWLDKTLEVGSKALEKTKTYSKKVVHNIKTDDITFSEYYKKSATTEWAINIGFAAYDAWNGDYGSAFTDIAKSFTIKVATETATDYLSEHIVNSYSYSKILKEKKDLPTLPLPINDSGSDAYENAISILSKIDENDKFLNSDNTKFLLHKAMITLSTSENDLDPDEEAKKEGLKAIISFILKDYKNANKYSDLSIKLAKKAQVEHTLPSFIYATTKFYTNYNIDEITNNLSYSFLNEPDNPLIPLLLSIHLERAMYDGDIKEANYFSKIYNIYLS